MTEAPVGSDARLPEGLAGDLDFYRDLALAAQPPVLELGCGAGRLTLPIARAGVPILGLDVSEELLAIARCMSHSNLRYVQADMRGFCLRERFGLIFVPYRAFQYLLTEEAQTAALERAFAHLQPGGRLALDVFNAEAVDALARLASGRQASRRRRQGAPPRLSRTHAGFRLRYSSRDEMEALLRGAGFEVEALYGWFDRRPFDSGSTEMVWIARRPVEPPQAPRSASEFQR